MEQIMNYVKPELVVVALVLYFIGTWWDWNCPLCDLGICQYINWQ